MRWYDEELAANDNDWPVVHFSYEEHVVGAVPLIGISLDDAIDEMLRAAEEIV